MVINTIVGDQSFEEKYGRKPCIWRDSEKDRIKTHLEFAIRKLNERGRETKTLERYKDREIFPRNVAQNLTSRTPIFIDNFGTPCAVAHLMCESGSQGRELAQEIDRHHHTNYLSYVMKDSRFSKKIENWAQENGYTVEDLALIQPGYTPIAMLMFQSMIVSAWIIGSYVVNQLLAILINTFYFGEDTRLYEHLIGVLPGIMFLILVVLTLLEKIVTRRFRSLRCRCFNSGRAVIPVILTTFVCNLASVSFVLKDPWCVDSGGFWFQELWSVAPNFCITWYALKYLYMSRDPKNYEDMYRRHREKLPIHERRAIEKEVGYHTKRIHEGKDLTYMEKVQKTIHPAKHHWVKLKAATKLIELANRHKNLGLDLDAPIIDNDRQRLFTLSNDDDDELDSLKMKKEN